MLNHVQLFVTPWTSACQASLCIINSQRLLKLMSIKVMMPYNHFILCHPFILLHSIFPSIRVFSNESTLSSSHQVAKYWSFSFRSVLPMNIQDRSFRKDWFDLLAVQGSLKSFSPTPQYKSINSSVLRFLYSPILTFKHDY